MLWPLFFFQAEDGIRDLYVTGVQTCALPICGQLISAAEQAATRELARTLGLKTGAPLIRIETLRSADRTPICVSTSWLSAERFPDAGAVFARARSMTKLFAHFGVRDYRRTTTRITAAIADASDAARLDLPLGHPVLVV